MRNVIPFPAPTGSDLSQLEYYAEESRDSVRDSKELRYQRKIMKAFSGQCLKLNAKCDLLTNQNRRLREQVKQLQVQVRTLTKPRPRSLKLVPFSACHAIAK